MARINLRRQYKAACNACQRPQLPGEFGPATGQAGDRRVRAALGPPERLQSTCKTVQRAYSDFPLPVGNFPNIRQKAAKILPAHMEGKLTMDPLRDLEALQALASTLTDSINGYEAAAEVATHPGIEAFLREKASERRAINSELRNKIESLGGRSDVSGSTTAALHRRFLDLRSIFQNDTKAAVAEVERDEGNLKAKFEGFIADQNVSGPTRELIRMTYERVRLDHSGWDQLKSSKGSIV